MKRKFALFVLILTLLVGCSSERKTVSIDNYEKTYLVSSGSISSNNKYIGLLKSDDESFLSFKMPGRITHIYVKEGDNVKIGKLLATLGGNEVKTQFSSAKDMLISLRNMYNSTSSMFDAQIKSLEAKVAQAKTGMEGMKTGLGDTKKITEEQLLTAEKQVKQAKIGLETAESNLKHTKDILKQKEKDIYSNSKNAISQSKILLNNFSIFVDQIFGISEENKHKNDAFELYLCAKNTSLKDEVKNKWRKFNNEYNNWVTETNELVNKLKNNNLIIEDNELKNKIYDNLKKTKKILILSRELSDKVFKAIDSSVSSTNFPQTRIEQYKQQITVFQKNIESALLTAKGNYLLGVKGTIQSIENLKKGTSMQLDLLTKQYQLAKAGYETAKQTYEQYKAISAGKVNEINTKYEVSKKQYEEALKGIEALKKQKSAQLSQIQSQINQVKGNKNLAAVNLGNIKLFAPYDGVVTQKIANLGQVIGAGMPIFKMADPKKIKGFFYVPIEEIKNIKIGQDIFVQALGKTLTGKIINIYPSADSITKKIPIEIKILDKLPSNWKLGMYITGYPATDKIIGLLIPQDFLYYEYGNSFVYKKINDKYIKTYIKLGKCDSDFCIVKQGLKRGDIIK